MNKQTKKLCNKIRSRLNELQDILRLTEDELNWQAEIREQDCDL